MLFNLYENFVFIYIYSFFYRLLSLEKLIPAR